MNSTTWFILWTINFALIIVLYLYIRYLGRQIDNLNNRFKLIGDINSETLGLLGKKLDGINCSTKYIDHFISVNPYFGEPNDSDKEFEKEITKALYLERGEDYETSLV